MPRPQLMLLLLLLLLHPAEGASKAVKLEKAVMAVTEEGAASPPLVIAFSRDSNGAAAIEAAVSQMEEECTEHAVTFITAVQSDAGSDLEDILRLLEIVDRPRLGFVLVTKDSHSTFFLGDEEAVDAAQVGRWVQTQLSSSSSSSSIVKQLNDHEFSSQVFYPARVAVVLYDTDLLSPLGKAFASAGPTLAPQVEAKELVLVRATRASAPSRYSFTINEANPAPKLYFYGRRKGKYSPQVYAGPTEAGRISSWVLELMGAGLVDKLKEQLIPDLTDESFDEFVETMSGGVLVMFHAPWCGHCKRMAPEFSRAAERLASEKSVRLVKVDATSEKKLSSRYKVEGFPTMKYIPSSSARKNGATEGDFNGERTSDAMRSFVFEKLGKPVPGEEPTEATLLTDDNFNALVVDTPKSVFVKFFAPWCGHCKAMGPAWEQLAEHYKHDESVVIAKYDASRYNKASSRYPVAGLPTILWFPAGKKSDFVSYRGGRSFSELKSYVEAEKKVEPQQQEKKEEKKVEAKKDLQGKPGVVFEMNGETFAAEAAAGARARLVMFYATWCGHCKKLMPDYMKLQDKYRDSFDKLLIARYNAPSDPPVAKDQGVRSFPTIFFYTEDGTRTRYEGERNLAGLVDFLKSKLPDL